MESNLRSIDGNLTAIGRDISWAYYMLEHYNGFLPLSLSDRIYYILQIAQAGYYPVLAVLGVPVNLLTIVIMLRGKCGLSTCITRYLVAMAVADLLVIILDLILRHIPVVFWEGFSFLFHIPVCNMHAVLLYAITDCSVWFTVTFTFDRFVAICCQKLKTRCCTEKTATVVLAIVTLLSCLKNIFWYFMLTERYQLQNMPWFCHVEAEVRYSIVWVAIEFLHHILTPCVPFVLIVTLNIFTVRYILVSSRARKRLRNHSNGEGPRDQEMENRKKSIILLFVISANFILLWSMLMLISIYTRMTFVAQVAIYVPDFVQELGFMLQLLSCCTNTVIYAVTQTMFRMELKNVVKYPFTLLVNVKKR